jgi:uncharacterized protein YPO0396
MNTITDLQSRAAAIAETLAPDSAAAFLRYHRALIETLISFEKRLGDQSDNLRSLRNDITSIIHEAIMTYVSGLEAERSALGQEITELQRFAREAVEDRREMRAMLTAIAAQLGVIMAPDDGPPDAPYSIGGER